MVVSHILITQLQILEKYLHILGNYYRLGFFLIEFESWEHWEGTISGQVI